MWYALNEGTSMKIPLLPEKEYIIGRKDCDIVLENDKSISRRHASIKISRAASEQSQSTNRQQPRAVFTDLSRFGTLVNNAIVCGSSQELCHGDVLTVGQYKAVVRVVLEPLVVTTSCLDSSAKRTLQAAVHALGGHVVKEWERGETTHLVMSQITVTPKAVCCLIEQRSIVTPDFFTDMLAACRDCKQLPSADSHCPELSDSQVNPLTASFQPNPARTAIFSGKKFIFLQRRVFALLSKVIELGGGLCLLLEGRPRPPADVGELVAPGSVVLHADDRDALLPLDKSQWIAEARAILKRHGKRMVQEAEIGYAVLFGSTESYCNPDREAGRRLFLTMSQSVTSTQQPLVLDTQVVSGDGKASVQPSTPQLNNLACATTVVPSSVTPSVDELPEPECTKKRARQSRSSTPERAAKMAAPRGAPPARAGLGGDVSLAPAALLTDGAAIGTPVAWTSLKATAAGRSLRAATARASSELCQTNESREDAAGCSSVGRGRNGRRGGGEHLVAAVAQEEKEEEKEAAIAERATPVLHVPQARGLSSESVTPRTAELATSVKRERSPLVHSSIADACGNTGKPTVAAVLDDAPSDRDAVPPIKREAVDDEAASVDRLDNHRTRLHSGFGQRGAPRQQSSPRSGSRCTDATPPVPAAYPAQISSATSASAAASLASGTSTDVDAASSDIGGMNVIVQPLMRSSLPAAAAATAQPHCPVSEQNKDGLTLWNGKWVKNFKRFLKCGVSNLERLPRIIGGGDLVGAAALKRARLSDDAEYACPQQPLAATRRGGCDDWGDNSNDGGRDDDDVHVAAVVRSRSNSRPSTVAARSAIVDDDSMDDSSQQSRIDAIFDRVAGRRAKF